ncbi:hypothetical protein HG530_011963 [Fusarium avenaceum]|nr:hypothetical protein HG530_011963 [Fusarium avenaceum]
MDETLGAGETSAGSSPEPTGESQPAKSPSVAQPEMHQPQPSQNAQLTEATELLEVAQPTQVIEAPQRVQRPLAAKPPPQAVHHNLAYPPQVQGMQQPQGQGVQQPQGQGMQQAQGVHVQQPQGAQHPQMVHYYPVVYYPHLNPDVPPPPAHHFYQVVYYPHPPPHHHYPVAYYPQPDPVVPHPHHQQPPYMGYPHPHVPHPPHHMAQAPVAHPVPAPVTHPMMAHLEHMVYAPHPNVPQPPFPHPPPMVQPTYPAQASGGVPVPPVAQPTQPARRSQPGPRRVYPVSRVAPQPAPSTPRSPLFTPEGTPIPQIVASTPAPESAASSPDPESVESTSTPDPAVRTRTAATATSDMGPPSKRRRGPKPKPLSERKLLRTTPIVRKENTYSKKKKEEVIMWMVHNRVERLGEMVPPSTLDAEYHFKIPRSTIAGWKKAMLVIFGRASVNYILALALTA